MADFTEPVATVVNGHTFTIDTRYVLKESRILGKGSFGVVCTAYDSIRKINIAIKRIRPYANDEWDARHTLREIRLLKLLGPHPNIVTLYELSLFEPKTELYMMMELMDCDLHRVIQSKQPLTEKHHKCFIKQILEAIKAMHSIGVFHRDLKPGNILVSKDCQIRITDFGLARFMDDSTRSGQNDLNPMTEYVVTRWYRCPELLLSPNRPYSEAIDLWSIGCILGELIKRKPLFPGKSHAHQVQLVFEVVGYGSEAELGFPVNAEALSFLEKRCRYRKQPFSRIVPEASPQALDMLDALLAVNPLDRPAAAAALQFPFLSDAEILNDYSMNYLTRPSSDYFDFEHEKYAVSQLKEMIDQEVYAASASAYRSGGGGGRSMAPSQSATHGPGGAHVGKHAQQHTSSYDLHGNDETEGPVSQLATQVKNARLATHSAVPGHAMNAITSTNSTAYEPRGGGGGAREVSGSNPFRSAAPSQDAAALHHGNILTAVRNDMIGGSNPVVASNMRSARKTAPKTPSPRKIDIILQKDMANKQKALKEQSDEMHTARSETSAGGDHMDDVPATSGGPSNLYASIFARRTNTTRDIAGKSMAESTGAVTTTETTGKRFGRLMSAFPSLPGGARSNATTMGASKLYKSSGSDANAANKLNNINTRASLAMMHSGSNVLHHEYDHR